MFSQTLKCKLDPYDSDQHQVIVRLPGAPHAGLMYLRLFEEFRLVPIDSSMSPSLSVFKNLSPDHCFPLNQAAVFEFIVL